MATVDEEKVEWDEDEETYEQIEDNEKHNEDNGCEIKAEDVDDDEVDTVEGRKGEARERQGSRAQKDVLLDKDSRKAEGY